MKKLYILLIVGLPGFIGNAQVSYPSEICSSIHAVGPIFAPNTSVNGTFSSSFAGLLIDAATGVIFPAQSAPGTYVVTYTVPPGPPDFIAQSYSLVVNIMPAIIPTFTQIAPICYASAAPVLPSVSLEGIVGTWSPAEINTTATTTYIFTPNPSGVCSAPISTTVQVLAGSSSVITTANGSDTVYIDENNAVLVPLTLSSGVTGSGYTYEWFNILDDVSVGTASSYTVDTYSPDNYRLYFVKVTNTETGCVNSSDGFIVFQSTGTPPPFADRNQNLPLGATLADIIVSGTDVRWYASASDKNSNTVNSLPLPLNTILVDNTTYYASQTIDGEESVERNPVTAHLVLGIGVNELASVSYFPNPVKDSLTIKALSTIDNISIISMLGQTLKRTKHNQSEVVEDMNEFNAGTYFIKVTSGSKTEILKVVKQ